MPEAYRLEIKNKPSKIEVISPVITRKFIENEKWGFRITGGAEFGMPITVFQVQEGGRADQAGIRLGDTIIKINDIDVRNMSLAETNKRIESAGNDIKLSVKNFEEDENNEKSVKGHDVLLETQRIHDPSAAVADHGGNKITTITKKPYIDENGNLEAKLSAMQKRLAQIAQIPLLIQSTLECVTKTFEEFLPIDDDNSIISDGKGIRSSSQSQSPIDDDDDDDCDEGKQLIDDGNSSSSSSSIIINDYPYNNFETIPEEENENISEDGLMEENNKSSDDDDDEDNDEMRLPTEEQLQKLEKQLKLKELERSWPWGDREKKIYKRSNCHLVPSKCINSIQMRISQLNESQLMVNYMQNEHGIN